VSHLAQLPSPLRHVILGLLSIRRVKARHLWRKEAGAWTMSAGRRFTMRGSQTSHTVRYTGGEVRASKSASVRRSTHRAARKGGAMPGATVHLALLCLLLSMLAACARESRSSTTWTPDAFAREWLEAFNSHDLDRILAYYADNAYFEDVPSVENGWAEPCRGHQMIREAIARGFKDTSDLGFEFVSASGTGDRMVVEWIMTGSHWRDFTGNFSIRGVSVLKLEGDKIASDYDYYDMYLLVSKLGMVPALDTETPKPEGIP
jgi:steroid delta-isomerase-like uncharacterized protein